MSILTAPELMRHMRLDRRDFIVEGFSAWCKNSSATSATIEVTDTHVYLSTTIGGVTRQVTLALATYTTLAALIAAIREANDGTVWGALQLNDSTGVSSSGLEPTNGAISCVGYSCRATVTMIDISWITKLCTSAQYMAERFCGRRFELASYVQEIHDPPANGWLFPRNQPISGTVKVERVTSRQLVDEVVDEDTEEVDASTYKIDWERGSIYRQTGWGTARQSILVSYSGGFSTVPEDLKMLIADIAAMMYYAAGRDPSVRSERLGSLSKTFHETGIPPAIEERLYQYLTFNE